MAKETKVEPLKSLYELTAPSIAKAEEYREKRARKRRNIHYRFVNEQNREDAFYENVDLNEKINNQMPIVKAILEKAGISARMFPFKPQKNKDGEITYVSKGKNKEEIKENIHKYKEELEKALEKGKITQEEFEKLNQNLEDLMEENKIELDDKDVDFEITNDEIEENLDEFIVHNFGNEKVFEDLCKEYDDYDLDERKNCLQEFNTKINVQLGIAGDLSFSTNPNLKFENSFTKNGFMLTEAQVRNQDLKPVLYTMMEKSMMRQKEIQMGQKIEASKKKQMHEKIMEERRRKYQQYKEKEDRKFGEKTRQRMRNMFNG